MNASTIRHFAAMRGVQRGRTDAANLADTPPVLSRSTARDIIHASRPARFWPLWFLLWVYGPEMEDGFQAGWQQGRLAAEAAARRRRILVISYHLQAAGYARAGRAG